MANSMTKFKSLCVKQGLNPATATALKRMINKGQIMPVDSFTEEWTAFCSKYSTWNCVNQLAQKVEFNFLGVTKR